MATPLSHRRRFSSPPLITLIYATLMPPAAITPPYAEAFDAIRC